MNQDWDIRIRGSRCAACETAFEDGEAYQSALFSGDSGYERGDFCEPCWRQRDASHPLPYSTWRGIYRRPPAAPEETLKKETAESLLRKLMEDADPRNESVMYILAVMLERKKTLVEKDVNVNEDGVMHRIYEHRQSGETFLILDPHLRLDALEDVQAQVAAMLGAQTGPAAAEPPSIPDAPTEGDSHAEQPDS